MPTSANPGNGCIVSGPLTGSGTLTKTGFGTLWTVATNTGFTGRLVIAPHGGAFELRGMPARCQASPASRSARAAC